MKPTSKPSRQERMNARFSAQTKRVGANEHKSEIARIRRLYYEGRISRVTRETMERDAIQRLAYRHAAPLSSEG